MGSHLSLGLVDRQLKGVSIYSGQIIVVKLGIVFMSR